MTYLSLALLVFIPALIATPFHNQLERRDLTTVYLPTTVYETVEASSLMGVYRKTKKVYKHRHEVIKQNLQGLEDDIEELNQQLDPYREFVPGQAAKYRQEYDDQDDDEGKSNYKNKESQESSGDDDNNEDYDGHCKEDDEWCCEEGEEGCDENEYEECNEGEEGCEIYYEDEETIIRELDFEIYIVDIEEYGGSSADPIGDADYTLLNGTTIDGDRFATEMI